MYYDFNNYLNYDLNQATNLLITTILKLIKTDFILITFDNPNFFFLNYNLLNDYYIYS